MMTGYIILFVLLSTPFVLLLAYFALSSRHRKASLRPLAPVGRTGTAVRDLDRNGFILVDGELWPARAHSQEIHVRAGTRVRVVGARGHALEVEPLD